MKFRDPEVAVYACRVDGTHARHVLDEARGGAAAVSREWGEAVTVTRTLTLTLTLTSGPVG